MVDFDNESTITTPAGDVVKILILQRRNDFLEALEQYHRQSNSGIVGDSSIVKARLTSLFFELYPALKNSMKKEDFLELETLTQDKDPKDFARAFNIINIWLYHKNLIKFDSKKQYDRARVEEENKAHKV